MAAILTNPTKVVQTKPLAWQDIASTAGTVVIADNSGAGYDVTTAFSASFHVRMGRQSGTAFTAGWPNVRFEAAKEDTPGNESWAPLFTYQPAVGASIGNTTLNGANTAGDATSVFTATTNFAVGNICYLKDASTGNYELARIKAISGTTITWERPLAFNHANGSQVTNQAEMLTFVLGLETYRRLRVLADNANGGQAFALEVSMTFETNLSSA